MDEGLLSRRRLLRGAVCAAGGAVAGWALRQPPGTEAGRTEPVAPRGGPGGTGPPAVDYASAVWTPAVRSNYTPARRPASDPVDYVVIHLTTDTFPTMVKIFQDPERAVSAHYLIRAADGGIAQCVREPDIAWHTGNWEYNTRSIGIEHEGWLEQRTYSEAMYRASAALTAAVCARHGIPVDRKHILGHNEIPDATHEDPGPYWDWDTYMRLVKSAAVRYDRMRVRPLVP
ncbi:N-acetylmuramoyl-L-alanine amidase [Streptomyces sp. NPDC002004]